MAFLLDTVRLEIVLAAPLPKYPSSLCPNVTYR